MQIKQSLSKLYKGYQSTPPLWNGDSVYGFEQFQFEKHAIETSNVMPFTQQRLGKLVEQFVGYQLQQQNNVELLEENVQIKNGKQTIGELDALFLENGKPIHLEIIYKFYLYDTLNFYREPLAYWIGPNRKDTLLYKLEKLKNKQFPLLKHVLTKPILSHYKLDSKSIKQQLCFKAQLFLPYNNNNSSIQPLNPDCIMGYHLPFNDFDALKGFQFYIPEKLEWLTISHCDVDWLGYSEAKSLICKFTKVQRSPMCWIKNRKNEIDKCFITYW